MKYHAKHTTMWDAWFLNIEGKTHAFHLQMPEKDCPLPYEEAWGMGHAVSGDLLHWQQCPGILPPLRDETNPEDYQFKFTGCAVEKDNRYYLFYTMRDQEGASQRIGLALSDDGYTWTRYAHNPVLEPDPKLFIGYGERTCDWGIVDCRDIVIVKNPDGLYYGYFAVAADIGRLSPVGVVAVATSRDLLHWENQTIVYTPRSNGIVEVPDVYTINGQWFLTLLTGCNYYGRAATEDEYVTRCTIYAVADNPLGPFVEPKDNILLGGIQKSGYTCRTLEMDGKRYLFYVDSTFGGETLSLPKEVRLDSDGKLVAYRSPLLESLRTRQLIEPSKLPEIRELPYTSFAWKTLGGTYQQDGGKMKAQTENFSWQAAGFGLGARSLELKADITVNAKGAGFWVSSREGDRQLNYVFSIEPEKGRILLTKFYEFEYCAARKYPFEPGKAYQVRLLMLEGGCEVYINDRLLLQCGMEMLGENYAGLFCDQGSAVFEHIELYELEE